MEPNLLACLYVWNYFCPWTILFFQASKSYIYVSSLYDAESIDDRSKQEVNLNEYNEGNEVS